MVELEEEEHELRALLAADSVHVLPRGETAAARVRYRCCICCIIVANCEAGSKLSSGLAPSAARALLRRALTSALAAASASVVNACVGPSGTACAACDALVWIVIARRGKRFSPESEAATLVTRLQANALRGEVFGLIPLFLMV